MRRGSVLRVLETQRNLPQADPYEGLAINVNRDGFKSAKYHSKFTVLYQVSGRKQSSSLRNSRR